MKRVNTTVPLPIFVLGQLRESTSETILFLYDFLYSLSESVKSLILHVWSFFPRNWHWDSYLSLPELGRWPYRLMVTVFCQSLNITSDQRLKGLYFWCFVHTCPSSYLQLSSYAVHTISSPDLHQCSFCLLFFCRQCRAHAPSAVEDALSFQHVWTAWICMVSRDSHFVKMFLPSCWLFFGICCHFQLTFFFTDCTLGLTVFPNNFTVCV